MEYEPRWRPPEGASGVFGEITAHLAALESEDPTALPDLRTPGHLTIASDYSGQHAGARQEVLAFLLCNPERNHAWEHARRRVRRELLGDGRRMAFKDLGDHRRREALNPFLDAADQIPGLLFAVAIPSTVRTLFARRDAPRRPTATAPATPPAPGQGQGTPPAAAHSALPTLHFALPHYDARFGVAGEHLLRAAHCVALLIAGFSRPQQEALWLTDEDEIAPHVAGTRRLQRICAHVLGHYTPNPPRDLRCLYTRHDDRSRAIEDLTAMPDLAAGPGGPAPAPHPARQAGGGGGAPLPFPAGLTGKTRRIIRWLSRPQQPLRRLAFAVTGDLATGLHVARVRFGAPDA